MLLYIVFKKGFVLVIDTFRCIVSVSEGLKSLANLQ